MRGGVSIRLPGGTPISPVFPTCVGVFLSTSPSGGVSRRLPHVRGGVSAALILEEPLLESSPRAWGCFSGRGYVGIELSVFPTCVGVFLKQNTGTGLCLCLPHVRGGVSIITFVTPAGKLSSPRAWGCFGRG